ncbi:hypothetical protein NARC_70086 [Candidatus Nitrosocosmicus arcticus]|uniref:Uncharacterized protein n=1 Tax=Candidatus Nitrosocosmicus arcticus TaxID=2035267 RepID=A0A557SV80_9ARCH|nr:hypothetical protein NARC_70086 [Candidatus Nitrosocosmicus arcticus]
MRLTVNIIHFITNINQYFALDKMLYKILMSKRFKNIFYLIYLNEEYISNFCFISCSDVRISFTSWHQHEIICNIK